MYQKHRHHKKSRAKVDANIKNDFVLSDITNVDIVAVYKRDNNNMDFDVDANSDFSQKCESVKQKSKLLQLRRSKRLLESRNTSLTVSRSSRKKAKKRRRRSDDTSADRYKTFVSDDETSADFDALTVKLRKQLSNRSVRNSEAFLLEALDKEICAINNTILGKKPVQEREAKMSSTNKRKMEVEFENIVKPFQLIPQSQWVYSTPDKQKIKKIVAKEPQTQVIPAVYHTNKKMKVLYDLKENFVGKVNPDKFNAGQEVQIDKRFLKPICEVAVDESSNQFLSNDEKSIEINDANLISKTFDEPMSCGWTSSCSNDFVMDTDSGIYQVCTQRPSKSSKKLSRLNSIERRTLSFDETPKRTSTIQKHKSEQFLENLSNDSLKSYIELQPCSDKSVLQDCSNLLDVNRPSTSKGVYRRASTDVENMYLPDNYGNIASDCEFFSVSPWPEMPDMSSPEPLKIYPRKL